jgi:FkbM family methyltransferase
MNNADLLNTLHPEFNTYMYYCGKYFCFLPASEKIAGSLKYFDVVTGEYENIRRCNDVFDYTGRQIEANRVPKGVNFGSTSFALLDELVRTARRYDNNFLYVDVGGHAGTFALDVVSMASISGPIPDTLILEPGPIHKLIKPGYALNGWGHKVEVINAAASDINGYVLLNMNIGDNVSATIEPSKTDLSMLCESVRLDSALKERKNNFFLIKFDCQGMEYKVYDGLSSIIKNMNAIFFAEFLPHTAFNKMSDGRTYLEYLDDFYVFHNGHRTARLTEFNKRTFMDMYNMVLASEFGYCDLVMINKKTAHADKLRQAIIDIDRRLAA